MKQSRMLSPVTLAAIAAQILSILVMVDVIDIGLSDAIDGVVGAVLQLLVALGVLNNPTDKEHF